MRAPGPWEAEKIIKHPNASTLCWTGEKTDLCLFRFFFACQRYERYKFWGKKKATDGDKRAKVVKSNKHYQHFPVCPSEHHYIAKTLKFSDFLNQTSTMLNNVFSSLYSLAPERLCASERLQTVLSFLYCILKPLFNNVASKKNLKCIVLHATSVSGIV